MSASTSSAVDSDGLLSPDGAGMVLISPSDTSASMLDGDDDDVDSHAGEEDIVVKVERDEYLKPDDDDDPNDNKKTLAIKRSPRSLFAVQARQRLNAASATLALEDGLGGASHQSTQTPFVPRRAEDWEPWKGVLHELYITHNRILKDIIVIMETTYNLKATPKMYKNQFARWNFFKYTVKKRPRARAAKGRGAHDGRLVVSGHAAVDSILTPMLHGNDRSRVMQAGLGAVRHFLHGYIDLDAAHLKHEEVARFDDPCYRYFKTAMDLFDLQENVEGGRVLRLAFLQVERKIAHPTIKSFSDLCFLVPHLLLESGRKDILSAYLRYLTRLASLKFGSHPFTEIAASFVDLLDQPEDIMRYIVLLSQINSDTICNLEDMLERTRLWAQNQYLACLQTKDADASSSKDKHKHPMIRLESQSVYWAQNLIMRDPESDAITEQWLHRNFEADFAARCEAYLDRSKAKMAAGEVPLIFATMIECLYIGLLNDYYEEMQNWPKVFEWGKRGLALATDEQYIIWSIHLEDLMRKHGSAEEAEELKQRRKEHVWLERVRMQVDRLSLT
ncbi:hypothetical protein B0H63DRAFT_432483 [Podospora didyma]|uniref:Clr5 domain-containing protein n=1 Tax=Podospora didyma TaxID=330526 RepID=A0AAE0NNT3_9PEZI|nr:hypothetical protein B0H63DRAFT_432483 [Podospora didyma]